MSRKTVRDTLAGVITPALATFDPNLQVYTFKKARPDRHDGIVCVYLDTGKVDNNTGYREDDAALMVYILLPDTDSVDDLLDQVADEIESIIEGADLSAACQNILHTGWEYERDVHQGWTALRLTYSILY